MELLNSKIKERYFQVSRKKKQVVYKAKRIRLTQDFSSATLEVNSRNTERKGWLPRNLTPSGGSVHLLVQKKDIWRYKGFREHINPISHLRKLLKKILVREQRSQDRGRWKGERTSSEQQTWQNIILLNVYGDWASLVVQRLRIRLPMQGTRVRALLREDPTCHGATKPVCHNYWACALEPASHNYWSPRA